MTDRVDWTDFSTELMQDVAIRAEASGAYAEDAFFEYFTEQLIDTGELDTADRVQFFQSQRGLRVDGYGGDPIQANGVLSLIVLDFIQYEPGQEPETLNQTTLNQIFKRLTSYLSKSLDNTWRATLEESDPAFALSDMIATRWPKITKVRLFLLSNRVLSARVDGQDAGNFRGVEVTYNLWDLSRLGLYVTAGTATEQTFIDLVQDFGGGIQALPAHIAEGDYQAYLTVIPGEKLARIYDRWGARLLESNVRVFLQAKGKVNRGIRNTILGDPAMFFAYNNGLSATAEEVETQVIDGALQITGLKNFQIVNGGQTTASIHAALIGKGKEHADLAMVFVQMKLSIVPPERAEEVVPKISEYANSQNKVSAADFFSNHAFYQEMQAFSRRIYAPAAEGNFRQTKWFFERTRGQYAQEKSRSKNRHFEIEFPKDQVITKTDLARNMNPWDGFPHLVSRGAQKNFGHFTEQVTGSWDRGRNDFNEGYYRELVAKAIAWDSLERLVGKQPWYQGGGLRSRVVPYAMAKLAQDAAKQGRYVNFDRIWKAQTVSSTLSDALVAAATAAYVVIADAPNGNPLEFAKQDACWVRVQALTVGYQDGWLDGMLTASAKDAAEKEERKKQRELAEIRAQIKVAGSNQDVWKEALVYSQNRELAINDKDLRLFRLAGTPRWERLSGSDCVRLLDAFERIADEGFMAQL